jgi:hypothetical protein
MNSAGLNVAACMDRQWSKPRLNDACRGIDGYVKNLAARKRFEVAHFLLDGPHLINRGVNPLRSHGFENFNDASGVLRRGSPDL